MIKTAIGAYRQADLEAMGTDELIAVMTWALSSGRAHAESVEHAEDKMCLGPCEACDYYELLFGAAFDLLDERGEDANALLERFNEQTGYSCADYEYE